jgi:hypothetical protein
MYFNCKTIQNNHIGKDFRNIFIYFFYIKFKYFDQTFFVKLSIQNR